MLTVNNLTVTHDNGWSTYPASFSLQAGTMTLLCGPMAAGKTSLLRAIVGVADVIDGAAVTGRAQVAGHDLTELDAHGRAQWIGYVSQQPASGFVGATVEAQVARILEIRNTSRDVMAQRVSEALAIVGISALRHRTIDSLSAGQVQRVALAAALVSTPKVLICDEPTALLDPQGAADILAVLQRLTRDYGMTVLVADHHVDRYTSVDNVIYLDDTSLRTGPPEEVLAGSLCEPVTLALSRTWGTHPAITLAEARASIAPAMEKVEESSLPAHRPTHNSAHGTSQGSALAAQRSILTTLMMTQVTIAYQERTAAGNIEHITAVRDASLYATSGERVALMGANGAGKSSLLWALRDQRHMRKGSVVWTHDQTLSPVRQGLLRWWLRPRKHRHRLRFPTPDIRWVPADPDEVLIAQTVEEECSMADREWNLPNGTTADLVATFLPHLDGTEHPRSLSAGNKHLLAVAVLCGGAPQVVALDEPTRSLDPRGLAHLESFLRKLSHDGCVVFFASHDVDSIARCATRVVWLDRGDIIADLPPRELFVSSLFVRPLVTRLCAPWPVVTVEEATSALQGGVIPQETHL